MRPYDDGATAIEYSLLAGLIAVVIAGSVGTVGSRLVALFQSLVDGVGW